MIRWIGDIQGGVCWEEAVTLLAVYDAVADDAKDYINVRCYVDLTVLCFKIFQSTRHCSPSHESVNLNECGLWFFLLYLSNPTRSSLRQIRKSCFQMLKGNKSTKRFKTNKQTTSSLRCHCEKLRIIRLVRLAQVFNRLQWWVIILQVKRVNLESCAKWLRSCVITRCLWVRNESTINFPTLKMLKLRLLVMLLLVNLENLNEELFFRLSRSWYCYCSWPDYFSYISLRTNSYNRWELKNSMRWFPINIPATFFCWNTDWGDSHRSRQNLCGFFQIRSSIFI